MDIEPTRENWRKLRRGIRALINLHETQCRMCKRSFFPDNGWFAAIGYGPWLLYCSKPCAEVAFERRNDESDAAG